MGVFDNFFDLGGDSLLAVRLQTRLAERLSRPISVLDIFRYPTVAALREFLAAEDADQADLPAEARERGTAQRLALARGRRDQRPDLTR
ncbi:hypothetical protein FE391_31300 [Nonomuraea sp. KC401]|nr:hypothetical protein FE391_31300 [Nonomuraea sp. KC401]